MAFRPIIVFVFFVMTLIAAGGPSAAARSSTMRKTCSPLPKKRIDWPSKGLWIGEQDGKDRRIRLTLREAIAIGCAIERHVRKRRALRHVAKNFHRRVKMWRTASLEAKGPRIGTFWVSLGDRADELVLRSTLSVRKFGRYGLIITLRRVKASWRIEKFGGWTAHRRRR